MRKGGAEMNLDNQGKKESMFWWKAYPMIHLLCQEPL